MIAEVVATNEAGGRVNYVAVLGVDIADIKTSPVAMVGDVFDGKERMQLLGWQGSAVKFGSLGFIPLELGRSSSKWARKIISIQHNKFKA